MKTSSHLKKQFIDSVEVYRNYFQRTLGIAFAGAFVCIIGSAILLRFSNFDHSVTSKQVSLLSYFFHFYSKGDTYSLVDLTKSVFLFLVSLFAIGLLRIQKHGNDNKEIPLGTFVKQLTARDFGSVIGMLLIVSLVDFILFKISGYFASEAAVDASSKYLYNVCYELRVYLPLLLFSLTVYALSLKPGVVLSFKRIVLLLVSLWLMNVFAYEFMLWMRAYVLGLILMPVTDAGKFYYVESILGIPLILTYFLGYYSAMTTALKPDDE